MILIEWLYTYCTQFIIHFANWTDTSYYEVNFFLFIVLYPALIIGLLSLLLIQRWRIHRLKRRYD